MYVLDRAPWLDSGDALAECPLDDLAGFQVEKYSKSQVVRAGKIISARNPTVTDEVVAAFRLAHEWRAAHLIPMRKARGELTQHIRRAGASAFTAGRLKRFQSIRTKLRRRPESLYQMQDISGVRAICRTMDDVRAICGAYRDGRSAHPLIDEDDYITAPKPQGYRSTHFVLRYEGDEALTGGNRLTVEVQVRTRLQHAWATAVEAVGLVRKEELKSGLGDPDWLRFFDLMSAEFAVEECCPISTSVPQDKKNRREELRCLETKLDALARLNAYKTAIDRVQSFVGFTGETFLIQFNLEKHSVNVIPGVLVRDTLSQYFAEEQSGHVNTVFVEVDRVQDLTSAYPNYFMDVEMFADRLQRILNAPPLVEPPRPGAQVRRHRLTDWLRWRESR